MSSTEPRQAMEHADVDMDPLDAYMASLQLPEDHAQQANGHLAPASDVVARDWRRASGGATAKNRRYRRLQQLLQSEEQEAKGQEQESEDAYFSDAMMQQRSPALFHFYLGQYLPERVRAEANEAMPEEASSLSAFLMKTRERSEMEMRRMAEQEKWGGFEARDDSAARKREQRLFEEDELEEEEDSSSDEDEDGEMAVSIEERRRVLVEVMSARFLHGEDGEYVDYAAVDADETLDDLDEMDRDAQDRYFDAED